MDKGIDGIAPKNLDGTTVVNTVNNPLATEANKPDSDTSKQDYYVDPLEQEALMKEKLAKIEEQKNLNKEDDDNGYIDPDETIRPDMNVTGFFSTGATAKKESFIKTPASKNVLIFCALIGVVGGIFTTLYLALLISSNFGIYWLYNWVYAVFVVGSIFAIINGIRSTKAPKDSLKRLALIGIIGSAITLVPILAWLLHWITSIA
jgi:hypothetical protein